MTLASEKPVKRYQVRRRDVGGKNKTKKLPLRTISKLTHSAQKLHDISHPRLLALRLSFVPEGFADKRSLLGLDIEDSLLNRVFHDESPHRCWTRLAQAVDSVHGLVFDGRCPPCSKNISGYPSMLYKKKRVQSRHDGQFTYNYQQESRYPPKPGLVPRCTQPGWPA